MPSRGQSNSRQSNFGDDASARSEVQGQDQDEVQQDQIVHDQDEEAKNEAYASEHSYPQVYEEEVPAFVDDGRQLIEDGEEEPLDDQDH